MTEATVNPTPTKASLWEDFIDIFYQPSAVFDRRRDGQFGLALLAIIIVSIIVYYALRNGLAPVMDAAMAQQAAAMTAKNPSVTPEQIAGLQTMMEKFAIVGYVVVTPILIAIAAAVLWLAGKIVDAKVAFVAAMMISTYSYIPRVVEMVVTAVQGLLLPPESITSAYSVQIGAARFLDSTTANPYLLAVLSKLDLFTIWTVVLMAIGLAVVAGVPKSKAAIAAGAVWVVTLLPEFYRVISQS